MKPFWYKFHSIPYLTGALLVFALFLIIFIGVYVLITVFCKKPATNKLRDFWQQWFVPPLCFLIAIWFSSLIFKYNDYQRKAGIVSEADRKELQTMLNLANVDNKILRAEIENLQRAQLNVQEITKVKEINLIKTDMVTTIAHTENFEDEPNRTGTGSHGKQFWLVTQYNLRGIKYGIDLEVVKVKLTDSYIYVYGIKPKYNGTENEEKKDVLQEIRKYRAEDGEITIEKILNDNESKAKIKELTDKYHKIDKERYIKTTDQFEWINDIVKKDAQDYIRTTLSPFNRQIIFVNEEDESVVPEDAYTLKEFYHHYLEKTEE